MRRTLTIIAVALSAAVLLAGPAAAVFVNPIAPANAPEQVEAFTPYLPQVTCDPTPKPGTAALRALLEQTYGKGGMGIARDCHVGGRSEHKEGRAIDWMLDVRVPEDKAIADHFLTWLLEPGPDGVAAYNARRLGVMYVIWNRQAWSAYSTTPGWKPYSGPSPHTDHIHISLSWAGAMKATSFWTGQAAAVDYGPCRKYVGLPVEKYSVPRTSATCPAPISPMTLTESPVLAVGATGPYVAQLQTRLKIAVDGVFGSRTAQAVSAFQAANGLPVTGRTDAETWTRLRAPSPVLVAPAPVAAAPKPTATPSPKPTATPKPAVSPKPSASPTPAVAAAPKPTSGVTPPMPVVAAPAVNKALVPYALLTLRQGARGPAVVALQKALRITADGSFGPKTAAAVKAFQLKRGMPADGVVRPLTWRALGAPALTPAPWLPKTRSA